MDFFDKLGKKASEAYKITADKTGKIAKETKIKFKMSELKSQIEELYEEIGKKVYESHVRGKAIEKNEIEEECVKIDVLAGEIEDLQNETLDLKDKKQCTNCFFEIDKEDKYCRNCGLKQDEEENTKIENINQYDAQQSNSTEKLDVSAEEYKNESWKTENKSDEEYSAEIEDETDTDSKMHVEKEKNLDTKTDNNGSNLEKTVQIESDVDKY